MPQTHSSNNPYARDPSAPLGSLQNPNPRGEGPEDEPPLGTPTNVQSSRHVFQTPFFQHVRPEDVLASGTLIPHSPPPHQGQIEPVYLQPRTPSPLPPPKPQAYIDVYPPRSSQSRPPPFPCPPSQLQLEPPSPQLPPRRVHFNEVFVNDDSVRERARRAAIARLDAFAVAGPNHGPRDEHNHSARPPPQTPNDYSPRPSLGPQRQSSRSGMARPGGRRDGTLVHDSSPALDDSVRNNLRGQSVPSLPRSEVHHSDNGNDGRTGSVNAIDDYTDTVADALVDPPMWELCAMCNDRPYSVKEKGSLYCWACYGDICAAERAQPWERCSICEDKPGVHQHGGSWFCKEYYGEACAAEKKHKKHKKQMARGR
ncbi:hypothetical protein MMC30_005867 [Trapelia coarctata]|nr:hypothetical protein [Trapelia coarctata]